MQGISIDIAVDLPQVLRLDVSRLALSVIEECRTRKLNICEAKDAFLVGFLGDWVDTFAQFSC